MHKYVFNILARPLPHLSVWGREGGKVFCASSLLLAQDWYKTKESVYLVRQVLSHSAVFWTVSFDLRRAVNNDGFWMAIKESKGQLLLH